MGKFPFDPGLLDEPRADWWLLRDSAVHQVESPQLLDDVCRVLRDLGYPVREFDAAGWTPTSLHDDFAQSFEFPDWYGRNLDALDDLLRDVAMRALGVEATSTGTVLVLRGFASFRERHLQEALTILDIWASQAWTGLIVGHPMILLVEAPDSTWFEPVGASPVLHFRRWPSVE